MENPKENIQYEYIAFISYNHLDKKIAKKIQDKIEHYKLPTSIEFKIQEDIRAEFKELPEKMPRLFRDETELEPGQDLTSAIKCALIQSKYLIVVCSPNSAKSYWVNKEINYFIELGRADQIIPIIIEGTAHAENDQIECLPITLRKNIGNKDVLAANISELGGFEAAIIKVIARMLNLRFDSLWKRFERSKKRKLRIRYATIICAFITILCVALMFIFQNRSLNENIRKYKIMQSNVIADIATDELNAGNIWRAIKLGVLYSENDSLHIPYTFKIESLLRNALKKYSESEHLYDLISNKSITHRKLYVTPNGKYFILRADNSILIEDNIGNQVVQKDGGLFSFLGKVLYVDNNLLVEYYLGSDEIVQYNLPDLKPLKQIKCGSNWIIERIKGIRNYKIMGVNSDSLLTILDPVNLSTVSIPNPIHGINENWHYNITETNRLLVNNNNCDTLITVDLENQNITKEAICPSKNKVRPIINDGIISYLSSNNELIRLNTVNSYTKKIKLDHSNLEKVIYADKYISIVRTNSDYIVVDDSSERVQTIDGISGWSNSFIGIDNGFVQVDNSAHEYRLFHKRSVNTILHNVSFKNKDYEYIGNCRGINGTNFSLAFSFNSIHLISDTGEFINLLNERKYYNNKVDGIGDVQVCYVNNWIIARYDESGDVCIISLDNFKNVRTLKTLVKPTQPMFGYIGNRVVGSFDKESLIISDCNMLAEININSLDTIKKYDNTEFITDLRILKDKILIGSINGSTTILDDSFQIIKHIDKTNGSGGYVSCQDIVDGTLIRLIYSGLLECIDLKTNKVLWSVDCGDLLDFSLSSDKRLIYLENGVIDSHSGEYIEKWNISFKDAVWFLNDYRYFYNDSSKIITKKYYPTYDELVKLGTRITNFPISCSKDIKFKNYIFDR